MQRKEECRDIAKEKDGEVIALDFSKIGIIDSESFQKN